jgi:hypothetical protein
MRRSEGERRGQEMLRARSDHQNESQVDPLWTVLLEQYLVLTDIASRGQFDADVAARAAANNHANRRTEVCSD